jgi:sugar porter (SP) family MFS transporter
MKTSTLYSVIISLIVALGGFLLGFDSAVISGATPFYKNYFQLTSGSYLIGFSVAAIILGAIIGNIVAGPLADKFGRKIILIITAALFSFCAMGCALSNHITFFIIARIIGGFGVGMAILIAPMYIAEIAPKKLRGTLVTFNQLNIVLGISIAFFSNYFIVKHVADPSVNWRWMLGVGVIPAFLYFVLLFIVPNSPRWLIIRNRDEEAKKIIKRVNGEAEVASVYKEIRERLEKAKDIEQGSWREVFSKNMKTVLIIGFGIAFFQQITGINAIFYYAPMIFQMAGGGKDAAFMQAAILGLTNVVMTLVSMALIDRLGRKPLLIIGSIGILISMTLVGGAFMNARYTVTAQSISNVMQDIAKSEYKDQESFMLNGLNSLETKPYKSETTFFNEVKLKIGATNYNHFKESILKNTITIHSVLILVGLLLFVASFAISLGPVMWTLLSEIFPNKLRGSAISVVGFWNSIVSFSVTSIFPVQLESLGSSMTYFIYALFGFLTLLFVLKYVPETKGKSLEELETKLIRSNR